MPGPPQNRNMPTSNDIWARPTATNVTLEQVARISSHFLKDKPIHALSIGVSFDTKSKIHILTL